MFKYYNYTYLYYKIEHMVCGAKVVATESSIVVDQTTDSSTGPDGRKAYSAYGVEVGGILRTGDRGPRSGACRSHI